MEMLNLNGVTAARFSNGVSIVNTTPHPITIQDVEGDIITVPTSVLVNADSKERQVDSLYVETVFIGTSDGAEIIQNIEDAYKETGCPDRLVIVGSIIAAQAYPEKIAAMCPVPGYERVAPSEKRMRCDKFTIKVAEGESALQKHVNTQK